MINLVRNEFYLISKKEINLNNVEKPKLGYFNRLFDN